MLNEPSTLNHIMSLLLLITDLIN